MSPKNSGNVPVNWLFEIQRDCMSVKDSRCMLVSKLPVNALSCRDRDVRRVMRPRDGGMEPTKPFPPNSNTLRDKRFEKKTSWS